MNRLISPTSRRRRRDLTALCAIALCLAGSSAQSLAGSERQFRLLRSAVVAGGARLHSGCYVLQGSVGQTAPGYSSYGEYTVLAGFWALPPAFPTDQMFLDGFEECSP